MEAVVHAAAWVLGIWGAAVGGPGDDADRLPLWSFDAPQERVVQDESVPDETGEDRFAALEKNWFPFDPAVTAETPPPRLLPPADEPDPATVVLGRSLLQDIENEPRFFPGLMKTVLLPATLTAEGLAWLLLPRSISFNAQTI